MKKNNFELWFKQLIADLTPEPKRQQIKIHLFEVAQQKIDEFCQQNKDFIALQKMKFHELQEQLDTVVAICKEEGEKIQKQCLTKILSDLGYNNKTIFAYKYNADCKATVGFNGYSIPGWSIIIRLLRKLNRQSAVYLGKKISPARSRLHLRLFEGEKHWYITAHIDKYNWFHYNIWGVIKSHFVPGNADYINGTKFFVESLKEYFNDNLILNDNLIEDQYENQPAYSKGV
jgi:hypothetical protein